MRIMHLLLVASVALSLSICKIAAAADEADTGPGFLDGFKLGGYSSAGINLHPGGKADARLNEVSLFVTWDNGGRLRFFSELEVEKPLTWYSGEGTTGRDSYFDVERFYLDYNLSEKLNLRSGRFLTPTGRWNVVHAAPLVWTSSRPLVTSRLFPEAVNGFMVYGAAPFSDKAFEYKFFMEAVQERHRDRDDSIPYKDSKGMRFEITGKFNWGLSLLETAEDLRYSATRYRMVGLDFMVQHKGWEFSGETLQRFYTNGHDGGSGAYLQVVAPLQDHWFAIGRVENFNRPAEGSSERWVVGAAWRPVPSRILKLEYVGGDQERLESPKGFMASFAILF
ncbi:hypothetical protein ACIKP9_11025 [Methylobacillus methanolivorans]|uniref:Porin n=1 Tax=Methylobacillus methanolivorans TaxID=1848927 RepID=A0ABW8GN25_9PROT